MAARGAPQPDTGGRVTVRTLIAVIRRLPADPEVLDPNKWYRTQKEHWLGWLSQYNTRGAYDRLPGRNRDARYAYNHIVEPRMLLWLADAAGIDRGKLRRAKRAALKESSMPGRSAAIRRLVPWEDVRQALWGHLGASRRGA